MSTSAWVPANEEELKKQWQQVEGEHSIAAQPSFFSKDGLKKAFYQAADKVTNTFPAGGATAGALIGGGVGSVEPGAGTVLGAVGGAGIGGMGGEAARRITRTAIFPDEANSSTADTADAIRNEGIKQGMIELTGQGLGRVGQMIAPGMARNALRIPKSVEERGADTGSAILNLPPQGKLPIGPMRPATIAKAATSEEQRLGEDLTRKAVRSDVDLAINGRPGIKGALPAKPTAIPLKTTPKAGTMPSALVDAEPFPRGAISGGDPSAENLNEIGSSAYTVPRNLQKGYFKSGSGQSGLPDVQTSEVGTLVTRDPKVVGRYASPPPTPYPMPDYPGVDMRPAVGKIDSALNRTNNPDNVRGLRELRGVLTKDVKTGEPLPLEVPPSRALQNRRDVDDLITSWGAKPRGSMPEDTMKQAYGEINNQFHGAVPGSAEIDKKLSSIIPVRYYANRAANLKGITENLLTAKGSSLTSAGAGLGFGVSHTPDGAFLGAVGGRVIPELIASPTVRMAGARFINSQIPSAGTRVGLRALTTPDSKKKVKESDEEQDDH